MGVQSSAGTTLGISSGRPTTYDQAGFAAKTYVTVGEITEIPEYGKTSTIIRHTSFDSRKTRKFKGTYDNGSVTLALARDTANAGQDDLRDANDSDDEYSFRVVMQDGTTQYFTGIVASYTTNFAGVDSIVAASALVEINDDILEFSGTTYTLTYGVVGGVGQGSILGTTPQTVAHGADGTPVAAVAASGKTFVSWSDGVTTPTRIDLDVTANLTVNATFTP